MADTTSTTEMEKEFMDVDEKVDEFKEENVTADGGVKKKIIKKGEGWRQPEKGFEVKVHYVGKLLDGTIFDSSRNRDEVFKFKVGGGQVIKGWEEGVQSMKKGEVALFTMQPEYAYGKGGSPPTIPPDATLQFEIELIDWIEEKDVSMAKDGGVLKRVTTEGEGWEKPKDDTKVKVNYTLKLASDGTVVDQKQDFEYIIGAEQALRGIEEATLSMKKGERAVVTIKSIYGYGSTGASNVPPDSDLKLEIELLEFEKQKERWDMTKEEKLEMGIKRKDEGNALFTQQKYIRAIKKYKAALDLYEFDTDLKGEDKANANKVKLPCYLNIAACKIKQGLWKDAIENATKALEIDGNNTKALFRRGLAYLELDEWSKSLKDFNKALEFDQNNAELKREYARLKQKMKEQDRKDKEMFAKMFSHEKV